MMKIKPRALLALFLFQIAGIAQQPFSAIGTPFPAAQTLSYRVEWHMVTAGTAKLQLHRVQDNWEINMNLESAGMVNRLYRVQDGYRVLSNSSFCGINSSLEAQEGKKHYNESIQLDGNRRKSLYDVHDFVKNTRDHKETDIAPCTHEIIGALQWLRQQKLDVGKSITVPITTGKKTAQARIEAQAKENITVDGKSYSATRYEAFVFDNVLFRKKGSLLLWLSDDPGHVPLQMRFQMGFPIGNISLTLDKAEKN